MSLFPRLAAAFVAAFVIATPAPAQQGDKFEPQVGQPGKDVIWVPTPDDVVDRMLVMAQVTPNDFVIDLGSGDGKIAIAAARKYGARAHGIEYNPDMVRLSQRNAQAAGVADKVSFRQADIFASNFSQATVITMYLLPALNLKLRPQILAMRPGTRVVSHSFSMEEWEPDEVSSLDGRRAYFWVVPANVAGGWTLETTGSGGNERLEASFDQTFQKISGTLTMGLLQAGIRDAKLRGFGIGFSYVDGAGVRRDFTGRVSGGRMEGSYRTDKGAEGRWTATRK